MSLAVYINPSFFERSYKFAITGLFVALIVIIISEIILIFYKNKLAQKYITYFAIIVFSLLISYDTIELFNLAKNCVEYPNYPKSSLDFFITIINLFTDLLRSKSGRY
jgi:FtsH-binding integral membrane protein